MQTVRAHSLRSVPNLKVPIARGVGVYGICLWDILGITYAGGEQAGSRWGKSAARPGVLFSPPARRGAGALRARGDVLEAEGRAHGPRQSFGGGLCGNTPVDVASMA